MTNTPQANILVVDDVPERLIAMEALLEELGQNVVSVASGREALRCLLQDEFAVILLDVNMPDLDGFETAALIRQRPRSAHTPIIFVTAFGDETHAFQGYSLGAVDYILTPVVPEILRAKVRVFVDLFHKNEQLKLQAQQQAALVALADRRATQLRSLAADLAHTEQRERRRLAQILHDHIQQLLVAAKMRVELAKMEAQSNPPQKELSEIDDLLDQSITASRSLAVELSPPVLNEAGLASALEWLARWKKEKYGLAVEVQCAQGLPPIAEELRITLFAAIRELLFNVVKHSGAELAMIRVELVEGDWLSVTVEDRGSGFDPDVPQERSDCGGLGLFGIRERLESLGGRCEIESTPGRGTLVRLFVPTKALPDGLPETQAADERSASTPSPDTNRDQAGTASSTPSSERIRVLLVDDHAILREGLKGLLHNKPQIEVVGEAADGCEALTQTDALHPDVVIMDINMPQMNGIEATRRIKSKHPRVRVIGLSLHRDQEVIASVKEAGASAYLTKDGPHDQLIQAILEREREPAHQGS